MSKDVHKVRSIHPIRASARRQKGIAIITALLIVALAVTILSSLFWQQGIAFQRLTRQGDSVQIQWLERAAIDWVGVILKSASNDAVTHLGQIWAVPVAETSLKSFLAKNEIKDQQLEQQKAVLSGYLSDAQGRYNVRNLISYADKEKKYVVNPGELAVLKRLMTHLRLPPNLADSLAQNVLARFNEMSVGTQGQLQPQNAPQRIESFLPLPGMTNQAWLQLQEFIFYFPIALPINVNTASVELISAVIPEFDVNVLRVLLIDRARIYAVNNANFFTLLGRSELASRYTDQQISTKSGLFFLTARVQLNNMVRPLRALIDLNGTLMWKSALL